MALMDFLFGKRQKMQQVPTMDPQQLSYLQNLLGMSQQGLQSPYAGFEPIEQQARSQFQQSIPSLAERFTSLSPSAQRSSGFQSALGRAQGGLEESLAAMKAQYGLQNRGQMMQMGQMGMQPRFENVMRQAQPGFLQQMAGPLMQAGMGMATGGMMGAGMLGRGLMNSYRSASGGGNYGELLPMLMMRGGM